MILIMRTDSATAGLGLYDAEKELEYFTWEAGRNLSTDIHEKLDELLSRQKTGYWELDGIVLFKGPGSFTGLRIGASVALTLASELDIPISGSNGKDWISDGIRLLKAHPAKRTVELEYGSAPKTTRPKK